MFINMSCGKVFVVRQCLLLIATCLLNFSSGILLAHTSVLNPAILSPNAVIKATPDQASWIAASHGIAGFLGFIVMSPIFEFFGRKTSNIITNLFNLSGCLIYYVATDVYSLAFGRLAQGLSIGGSFICLISLSECVSPKRRGYFIVLNKVSIALGSLVCHSLGFILDWRQIATLTALPTLMSISLYSVCAESPSFYAMQGQFDKCEKTFKWYRGDSLSAKKELKDLVAAQMENLERKSNKKISTFKQTMQTLATKEFRKSFFTVTLATLCLDSCGRYFLLAYLTQILEEITNNRSISMQITVAFDFVLIFSLCASCFIVKLFKRRTLLFKLGFCSVFLMFFISFAVIMGNKWTFLQHSKWLIPSIILLQTLVTNIGIVPITFTLIGEVFSLEHRAMGSFLAGIIFTVFYTMVMKLTPIMIEYTGVEGTYSIYGLCLLVCLLLLQLILPETKDKTLQQIEDEIKGVVRNNSDTELLKIPKTSALC